MAQAGSGALLLGVLAALGGELGAQDAQRSGIRFVFGVEYAAASGQAPVHGNWVGPTAGARFGNEGPFAVILDGAVQLRTASPDMLSVYFPGVWFGPSVVDLRPIQALALATVALELGTSDRLTNGGPFVAVRAGGGAGRVAAGDVIYSVSPWNRFEYRESGHVHALATTSVDLGLWLRAFGRANRISLRIEELRGRGFSGQRIGAAWVTY